MCLSNNNVKQVKKYRAMGHVLVKGWKVLEAVLDKRRRVIGYGSCMRWGKYEWKKGKWQVAYCGNKRLRAKAPVVGSGKSVNAGIHIFIRKIEAVDWKEHDTYEVVKPVWFYADEVRAVEMGWEDVDLGTKVPVCLVVNRAIMK